MIGSVAHYIIHLGRCSVLVIPQRMLDDVPTTVGAQAA